MWGLRVQAIRDAAESVLDAMLECTFGKTKKSLEFVFIGSVQVWWPAGPPKLDLVLECVVGRVQLAPFRTMMLALGAKGRVAERWWRALDLKYCGESVCLSKLLRKSIHEKSLAPFASQLVFQAAIWVEKCIRATLISTRPELRKGALRAECENLLGAIDDPNSLNRHLLKSVLCGVRIPEGFSSLPLSSDKASVCGLSLDAGIFCWPDNRACVAVPQVAFVRRGWSLSLGRREGGGEEPQQRHCVGVCPGAGVYRCVFGIGVVFAYTPASVGPLAACVYSVFSGFL